MGNEDKEMTKRIMAIIAVFVAFVTYVLLTGVFDKSIFRHISSSLYRMLIGYVFAILLGNLTAFILSLNKYLKFSLKPLIAFLMSIPTITWVPVLLVITGISDRTVIIAIFLGGYFQIVYNTLDGLENVDSNLIRVGKMLELNKISILFRVSLPASLNQIIVGMKLGISYSWRALVGAEMLGAAYTGLGYLVFTSRQFYDLNKAFCTLFLIGFLGYILSRMIILLIEKQTIEKWGYSFD
jgi:NitT/TauT family transport system permease protein